MIITQQLAIHIAYDNRAIDDAFASVLGQAAAKATQSQTTKTYCNKRVAYSQAQRHDQADCIDCITAFESERDATAEILANWPAHLPKPQL